MNEEYYSPTKRKLKMLMSFLISLIIITIVIIMVVQIFELKDHLSKCDCMGEQNPVNFYL